MEGKGRFSHKQVVEKAEKKFEIYRAREMRQLESEFNRAVKLLQQQYEKGNEKSDTDGAKIESSGK